MFSGSHLIQRQHLQLSSGILEMEVIALREGDSLKSLLTAAGLRVTFLGCGNLERPHSAPSTFRDKCSWAGEQVQDKGGKESLSLILGSALPRTSPVRALFSGEQL